MPLSPKYDLDVSVKRPLSSGSSGSDEESHVANKIHNLNATHLLENTDCDEWD